MHHRFELGEPARIVEHDLGERFAVEASTRDRAWKTLPDALNQCPSGALQATDFGVRIEHWDTGGFEHLGNRRLAHSDRSGECDLFHAADQPAFAQRAEQGNQRHPENRKMVALDAVEQLHAAALHSKYTDAISDGRPFGIQIGMNEALGQCADAQPRRFRVAPVEDAATSKSDRAGQLHDLAGEKAQMLGGFLAVPRLVEQSSLDADHAVASDHPVAGAHSRPWPRQAAMRFRRHRSAPASTRPRRRLASRLHIRRPRHRASLCGLDWTRRGSGSLHNLVEKRWSRPSAKLGIASTAGSGDCVRVCSKIHPRGSNLPPACG